MFFFFVNYIKGGFFLFGNFYEKIFMVVRYVNEIEKKLWWFVDVNWDVNWVMIKYE